MCISYLFDVVLMIMENNTFKINRKLVYVKVLFGVDVMLLLFCRLGVDDGLGLIILVGLACFVLVLLSGFIGVLCLRLKVFFHLCFLTLKV